MKKEYKKIIKDIKKLNEGESIYFHDYEILCINHKTSFMLIRDMDMDEMSFNDLVDFIIK